MSINGTSQEDVNGCRHRFVSLTAKQLFVIGLYNPSDTFNRYSQCITIYNIIPSIESSPTVLNARPIKYARVPPIPLNEHGTMNPVGASVKANPASASKVRRSNRRGAFDQSEKSGAIKISRASVARTETRRSSGRLAGTASRRHCRRRALPKPRNITPIGGINVTPRAVAARKLFI